MKIIFEAGEQVRAICNHAYRIREGIVYTVVRYEPEYYDREHPCGFMWPAYIVVLDDNREELYCYAHHFEKWSKTNDL